MGASPSVERAANDVTGAEQAIAKLEKGIKTRADDFKKDFFARIADALKSSKISDALEIQFGVETKVEYSNEFSIKAMTDVVAKAINAYADFKGTGPSEGKSVKAAATNKEALDCYVSFVNTIGEAAKSSSKSSTSFSFQMTRLGPGMIVFISALSSTITDNQFFGSEAVSATTFLYKIVRSTNDVGATTNFDWVVLQAGYFKEQAALDEVGIVKFKNLQLGLMDSLGDGSLTIDQWTAQDSKYEKIVAVLQKRLDNEHFRTPEQPQGRLLNAPVHPSATETPHNFAFINIPIKQMRWQKDHQILKKLNDLHGQKPLMKIRDVVAEKKELRSRMSDVREKREHLDKAKEVILKRLHDNEVGNINDEDIHDEVLFATYRAPRSLKALKMTDGECGGVEVGGRKIYWNQHISFDDSYPPRFDRHVTTQIRLDHPNNPIIGNIRTYLESDGSRSRLLSPANLQSIIPQNLFTWALDAHNTYTKKYLENVSDCKSDAEDLDDGDY